MVKGYLCLFLHAHLPFVRHPEQEHFLEENWLYEAITETYIPILNVFERLTLERVPFRVTMSLTPTLASMLKDPLLQDRYVRHLDRLIELSEKEIARTRFQPKYRGLALMYNKALLDIKTSFVSVYKKDLIAAFKGFQDNGRLEIVASCATHGFLPNLGINPASAKAQIRIGVDYYKKIFGRKPAGFWLPECGYYPGVDKILKEEGIRYFFVDSHGLLNANPKPKYSVYAPVYCPTGVAVFGRDWESSKQVWSSKEGYPGDPVYREYYRDIGFELEYDYIKPYIHKDGFRINTGLKYWRITGNTEHKEHYRPDWARNKAALHASNFMENRLKQADGLLASMNRKPIIVAPYDAELFGHWWFEGPQWIEFLVRKIAAGKGALALITPSDYLAKYPVNQVCTPSLSSWGYKGYCEHWLDGSNDWLYRHLHHAIGKMIELVRANSALLGKKVSGGLVARALHQAARELLLAESSDWPFILKTGTMVPYAKKRIAMHIGRFTKLYDDIKNKSIDESWLSEVEQRDNIFAHMPCAGYYVKKIKDEGGRMKREIKILQKGIAAHDKNSPRPAGKKAKVLKNRRSHE
jgi:1,4-alpha-glucan branching enzyme